MLSGKCRSLPLTIAIILLVCCSAVSAGTQNAQSLSSRSVSSQGSAIPSLFHSSPSPYFSCPTSNIRILITYDLSTGAEVYADEWKSLLTSYGYNVALLPFQQVIGNAALANGYDLILVDHSCGGSLGSNVTFEEASALVKAGKPIILLGGAHGIIDRLANYNGAMGQVSVTGIVQKAHDEANHPIFTSPYSITDASIGPPNSIEIFSQPVNLESYPENAFSNLHTFSILEGAQRPVIAALYSPQGACGRIYWWAFKDPSTLSMNGKNLFINTVEWMGGLTDLALLYDFLCGAESLNSSESAYWTGGLGDYFEPGISFTYYAFESLRLIGRSSAINASDLVNWLLSYCYCPAEGYFRSPNRYSLPSVWSGVTDTGMVLTILSALGALSRVDSTKISAYIRSCQLGDGFVNYPGDASKSIKNTYWALMALNVTKDLNAINQSKIVSYILSCQGLNPADTANYGGFADYPGGSSSAESTWTALASLKLIGALGSVNQTIVEHWLMNGYVASKGLFHDRHLPDYRMTVNYETGYSVASLAILGKLGDINPSLVSGYLSKVQFTDGGWSGANCTDEPIDEITDCYPVILGFEQLNRVTAIRDIDGFIGFLLSCLSPAPTCGFSNLPKTLSNTLQTYDGVCVLYDLGLLDTSKSTRFYNSILSSYNQKYGWFEWSRSNYPKSSDGYTEAYVNPPFEYSYMQRSGRGVIMTDLAVSSLLKLGYQNWTSLHAQEMWNRIIQCEVTSGSYSGYYKNIPNAQINNLTAGLRYTFYALDCLWALAHYLNMTNNFQSHLANATMTISKIMSLYDPLTGSFKDDGYVLEPYSQVETTYMALASLKLLNALSRVDSIKTTEFLQTHLYSNLADAYYSFKGLQVLGKLAAINTTVLIRFIKSSQSPDGAFKSGQSSLYRLDTSRMASEIICYYNQTWVAAKRIKLIAGSLQLPTTIQLGKGYLGNLTLADSQFNLPLTGAKVEVKLGTYEYTATETLAHAGRYAVVISVPTDGRLLGTQSLSIRCSKGTYQTSINQTTVEVRMSDGGDNKAPTEIDVLEPDGHSYVMTYNASVTVSICAFNGTQRPVMGAQLHLYVNNSLSETALSNSSGCLTFGWRPHSSGTYNLRVVFDGSDLLNASQTSRTVWVDKTPSNVLTTANCTDAAPLEIGCTLQIKAQLSERLTGNPIGHVEVSFIVTTPSGSRMSIVATTGGDGIASAQLTLNENGSYSIYSQFGTNGYYEGSTSNSLAFDAKARTENGGGNGDSSNDGNVPWVSIVLSALATPLGVGLIAASVGLLTIAYLTRAKKREFEPACEEVDDESQIDSLPPDVHKQLKKRNT